MLRGTREPLAMLRAVKEGETFRGLARGMDPNAATCFCAKKFPFAGFRLLFFFFLHGAPLPEQPVSGSQYPEKSCSAGMAWTGVVCVLHSWALGCLER